MFKHDPLFGASVLTLSPAGVIRRRGFRLPKADERPYFGVVATYIDELIVCPVNGRALVHGCYPATPTSRQYS